MMPGFAATEQLLKAVGGPGFDISARPNPPPALPALLPFAEPRSSLSGHLHEDFYGVTTKTVIGRRGKPLTADDIRETLRLSPTQGIALVLFGHDRYVERLWDEANVLIPQIAEGKFDAVVSPSYSNYLPRPRPEFFYASKRSLLTYKALQECDVAAIPRVVWTVPYDALRAADWANRNPAVTCVALDWPGSKSPSEWTREMHGLAIFDGATRGRLRYLINGPSTRQRLRHLIDLLGPTRLCLTASPLAKPPSMDAPYHSTDLPKKAAIFKRSVEERKIEISEAIRETEASSERIRSAA